MCPFCWLSLGLVAAGAASAGGVMALAVKVSRTKKEDGSGSSDPELEIKGGS